jgi:hypothetical protein
VRSCLFVSVIRVYFCPRQGFIFATTGLGLLPPSSICSPPLGAQGHQACLGGWDLFSGPVNRFCAFSSLHFSSPRLICSAPNLFCPVLSSSERQEHKSAPARARLVGCLESAAEARFQAPGTFSIEIFQSRAPTYNPGVPGPMTDFPCHVFVDSAFAPQYARRSQQLIFPPPSSLVFGAAPRELTIPVLIFHLMLFSCLLRPSSFLVLARVLGLRFERVVAVSGWSTSVYRQARQCGCFSARCLRLRLRPVFELCVIDRSVSGYCF